MAILVEFAVVRRVTCRGSPRWYAAVSAVRASFPRWRHSVFHRSRLSARLAGRGTQPSSAATHCVPRCWCRCQSGSRHLLPRRTGAARERASVRVLLFGVCCLLFLLG